jgi:hypothetical protein
MVVRRHLHGRLASRLDEDVFRFIMGARAAKGKTAVERTGPGAETL